VDYSSGFVYCRVPAETLKKKKKKKKKKNINLCFLLFSMRRLQKGFRFFLNKKNLKESTMVEQKEKNS
jgi:hypothetical protein